MTAMTKTILANLALSKIGDKPVRSLNDTSSKEGRLVELHYEPTLREVLRASFWPFAMRSVRLAEVDRRASLDTPQFRMTAVVPGEVGNALSLEIFADLPYTVLDFYDPEVRLTMSGRSRMTISGTATPSLTGTLQFVQSAPSFTHYPDGYSWSTDGAPGAESGQVWVHITQMMLLTGLDATLQQLAPVESYTAGTTKSTSSQIRVGNIEYWLRSGGANPNFWTLDGVTNHNTNFIPAGSRVSPRGQYQGRFQDGLLQTMQDSPDTDWLWEMRYFNDLEVEGIWHGIGRTPDTATWTLYSEGTGIPVVKATGPAMTVKEFFEFLEEKYDDLPDAVTFTPLGKDTDLLTVMGKTHLSGGVADAEVAGYSHAFVMPDDCLKLRAVFDISTGRKIDHYTLRRVGKKSCLLCNAAAVSMEHVQFVDDPAAFDPLFVSAFTTLFAARLARAICGSDEMESRFLQAYEALSLPNARTASAQDGESNENHPLREFLDGNLTKTRGDFFPRQSSI